MNRFLSCLALATVFSLPVIAHADTYTLQDFRLDGYLKSGVSSGIQLLPFGGLVTLNTSTGTFINGSLDDTTPPYQLDVFQYHDGGYSETYFDFSAIHGANGPNGIESLYLVLPVASLVGYQGGYICSKISICDVYNSTYLHGPGTLNFTIGTLTPFGVPTTIPATPEPSSLVLLGTGILGVVGAARRRFVM